MIPWAVTTCPPWKRPVLMTNVVHVVLAVTVAVMVTAVMALAVVVVVPLVPMPLLPMAATSLLALVLMGGVNYYTGQFYDIERITRAAQGAGVFFIRLVVAHAPGFAQ